MSFEFNEQQNDVRRAPVSPPQKSGLAGKLVQLGVAKNTKQANLYLLACAGLLFLVMFFALAGGNSREERLRNINNTDPITGQPMEIPN